MIPFLKISQTLNPRETKFNSYLQNVLHLKYTLFSNNQIYDQKNGVSISSPLACILANLFMGYHKKDWIEKSQVAKYTFHKRQFNDIFGMSRSELNTETFYAYLNTKQKI